ncbi:MAG: CapA family protein [Lachnospiraceae bacterium]|nr:CapA family protein [Lachnospiraceae bacterium]
MRIRFSKPCRIGGAFIISAYILLIAGGCGVEDIPVVNEFVEGGGSHQEVTGETGQTEPYTVAETTGADTVPEPMEPVPAQKAMVEVEMPPEPETVSEDVIEYEPVRIVFTGDMNFDKRYANMNTLAQRGGEMDGALDENIITLMQEADITMINNEFPYSDRGSPTPEKKFTFRAEPSTVHYLQDLGVDIVGLANNHAYDYGPDALLDTLDTLSEAGIQYVGAGRDIADAMTPRYIEAGGMTIAFTAATQIERSLPPDTKEATETDPGVLRTLDPEKYLQVIAEADQNADFTIAFVHWGSENVFEYEAAQKELAEKYAEAGADLIIGAHPHVLQGFEYIGDVPVVYSTGNFWFNSKTLDSCMIEATINEGVLEELRFIPCIQKGCFTSMLHKGDSDFDRILSDQISRSADNIELSEDGIITGKP